METIHGCIHMYMGRSAWEGEVRIPYPFLTLGTLLFRERGRVLSGVGKALNLIKLWLEEAVHTIAGSVVWSAHTVTHMKYRQCCVECTHSNTHEVQAVLCGVDTQ